MRYLRGSGARTKHVTAFYCPTQVKRLIIHAKKCGASRDVEEIKKKMRSEILQLSDETSLFLSSGSILV
ncbi:hypothetical protein ZEAMMB73_Zm00001d013484 [Zea mays]|uniref:Uncharacterized protein n=1 Tax=Zea mays TaxID=4577 RepID=A0A1D6GJW0_MAIZE|nr:hypothetical protein ZEAMMB73_Zm00001d013484 [Zea mays]